MILKPYYLGCLSHASYLLGDEESRTAIIVDPQRDVDQYLADAAELGLEIRHVVLTHFHADFVAGHLELRDRTGATVHLGRGAEAEFDFVPMGDGDAIDLPGMRIDFLETPGHTPEMVNLVITDKASPERPHAVLTGDTLFNGDVGRPDLLASIGHTAEELAGMLYHSLHDKLLKLPDGTLVYPAHGAGSMCGKALADELVTTIGQQRRVNAALQPMGKDAFIRMVTTGQPEAPPYFALDAMLNRQDHPTIDGVVAEARRGLVLDAVLAIANRGAQVVDVRDAEDWAAGHLEGSILVSLDGSYATWAGTLLDPERPIVLLTEADRLDEAATRLGRIGFDRVVGHVEGGMEGVRRSRPDLVRTAARMDPEEFVGLAAATVLDVRTDGERDSEWIEDTLHIPLHRLKERLDEVPSGPLVIHCGSGYRSGTAMSLLAHHGHTDLTDVRGGMEAIRDVPHAPVRRRIDGVVQVAPGDAQRMHAEGATILDVREDDEWQAARIPGAVHAPLSRLEEASLPHGTLVVQCRSGRRSHSAAKALAALGHEAVNLAGGLQAWSAAGLPIEVAA